MTESLTATDEPDHLSALLDRIASGDPDGSASRGLYPAVHEAIYPMCLRMLGNPDAAREAEQATLHRLLEHLQRRDPSGPAIIQGTAYVRQVARNICHDLGRQATDARRERPTGLIELNTLPAPALEPVIADMTPPTVRTSADRALQEAFGFRSKQLLKDIAGLSAQELRVLALRLQGMSYGEVAQQLGGGLSTATAQTQGERAMHHLRGRVHVQLWRQEPLGSWTPPRCAVLAQLKAETQRRLTAAESITTTLYRDIGKHLDPHPNRSHARGDDDPACATCHPELKRFETDYLWLLGMIPPLAALVGPAPVPPPQPVANSSAALPGAPTPLAGPPPRYPGRLTVSGEPTRPKTAQSTRRRRVTSAVVALIIAGSAVLVVPPLLLGQKPLEALLFGPGGRAALPPEACKLITPSEVTGVLGEQSGPCKQAYFSKSEDSAYGTDRFHGEVDSADPDIGNLSFQLVVETYNFGTAEAARRQDFCASSDVDLRFAPLAGLGDGACVATLSSDRLDNQTQVHVVQGSVLVEIALARPYLSKPTKDEAVRIATIVVGRLD